MPIKKGTPVVVFNDQYGITFGEFVQREGDVVELINVRICQEYKVESGSGPGGLMVEGPLKGSKVGVTFPRVEILHGGKVGVCTEKAAKAWRNAKWG